jgi:hypothetical protein
MFTSERRDALFVLWRLSPCTYLRDQADKLHGNRFVEWEVDGALSLLIPLELFCERGEERTRYGKQRIVLLETRAI